MTKRPDDVRAKISASLKGRRLSAETKAKIAATARRNYDSGLVKPTVMSPEHAAKLDAARRRPKTAEHKANLAAAARRHWEDNEEARDQVSDVHTALWSDDDYRAKMEAAFRKRRK